MRPTIPRLAVLILLTVLILLPTGSVSYAADFTVDQKLTSADFTVDAPANTPNLEFGQAVAVAGNWMAVGAPNDHDSTGVVYLYERVSGAWAYRTQIIQPNLQAGAQFGAAVDIYEAGGLVTVIIGAPLFDAAQTNQGRVFIFSDVDNGAGLAFALVTINADTPETDGHFGASVALFANVAAIGSPNHGGSDEGLVIIRGRNVGGSNSWGQIGLTKTGPIGSSFGTSVDLHGEYLIVGAPLAENISFVRTGTAYVYRQDLGGADAWGLKHTLLPATGQAGQMFGQSVGIWDSNLGTADSTSRSVIGSPLFDDGAFTDSGRVTFFTDAANSGQFTGEIANQQYGYSVALEGAEAIAGGPTETVSSQPNTGQVNTFTFNGTNWVTNTLNLTQTGAQANYFYGYSVDLSGFVAVIGAPGSLEDALNLPPGAVRAGIVETLEKPGTGWLKDTDSYVIARVDLPNTAINQSFGHSVAQSGEWLAIGVRGDGLKGANAGAVYMYRSVAGAWVPHSRLTGLYANAGDAFGGRVALDGTTLVVSASNSESFPGNLNFSGTVYVFTFNGTAWRQQVARNSPNAQANGFFGSSIDIHGDIIVVGASGENSQTGRVYIYRDLVTLTNPITVEGSVGEFGFGGAVSVYDPDASVANNEQIAVGAPGGDGAAYVLTGATFSTSTPLINPDPTANGEFGSDVSIFNNRVLVGKPSSSAPSNDAAYIFSGAGFADVATLAQPAGAEWFGTSVDLNDSQAIVGALNSGGFRGLATVYSRAAETWTELGQLLPADAVVGDQFGNDLVLGSDGQYIAGAPANAANGIFNSGAAYVFSLAPEVTVDPTALSVDEEGETTDTFTVSLNQAPATNVTIQLTFPTQVQVDTGSGFGASPQTVTLTPANATTGVTVTVRAIDDPIDEADPHTTTITTAATSSATPRFNGLAVDDVTVEIADNDTAGVSITQTGSSTAVTEAGGNDTYTIVLDTQPSATVNVAITFPATDLIVEGDTDGTYNTTFTTGNWNVAQEITVEAVNDRNFEGDHSGDLVHAFTSSDAAYQGITAEVDGTTATNTITANITDNETVELRWVNLTNSGAEGTTYIQNVEMFITSNPTGGTPENEVAITFEAPITFITAEAADIQVLFLSQTINAGNFSGTQFSVFHDFLNDALVEGDETFSMAIDVTTPYTGLTVGADHTATITDANNASLTLTGAAVVPESVGTIPLTVTLNIPGGATLQESVTVAVNLNDTTATYAAGAGDFSFDGPANTVNVTFPAGSGNGDTEVVDVNINEDVLVEGFENFSASLGTVTGPATAGPSLQIITLIDNESATVSFVTTSSSAPEGTTPHTVQTVLDITSVGTGTPALQGAVLVDVTQTPDSATTPADYTLTTTSVTFPAGAVDGTTRLIDIDINDDGIDELAETFDLGIDVVTGPATASGTHTVTIIDDDEADIIVTESGDTTEVAEGGAGDSYTIVLGSQPAADVTITISFDAAQLVVNGDTDGTTSITFTPSDWDDVQTVTVAAVDDTLVEANPHTSLITQGVSSADPVYAAFDPADVNVSITENDIVNIALLGTSTSINETAGPLSLTARLEIISNGTPGGTLTAPLTAQAVLTAGTAVQGSDYSISTVNFTFPAGTAHNATQPVEVVIINDRLLEASETFTVSLTLVSGQGTVSGSNEVTITDDEVGVFSFNLASDSTSEAAGTYNRFARLTITGTGGGTTFRIQDAASVVLTDTPGTAATPADYTLSTTVLNVPANAGSPLDMSFDAAIVSDLVFEADETFTIGFGAITGNGALSSTGTHVVTITDDETVSIALAPATVTVAESAATHTSTATLTVTGTGTGPASIQSALVVPVLYTEGTATEPEDFTTGAASITFAAGATSASTQDITVGILDDDIDENDETFTIGLDTSVATSDITFGNAATVVTITDDDTASITVTQSGGTTAVVEGGALDTYDVVLTSEPTAEVTVTLTFDAQVEVSTDGVNFNPSPVVLTFTPGNWDTVRTLVVQAVNDTVVEGLHSSTIVQTAESLDLVYDAIDPADVIVSITDNDTAEVIFSSAGFATVEGAVFSPGMTLKITGNGADGGSIAAPIVVDLLLTLGTAEASDVTVTTAQATFPAGATHDTVVNTHSVTVVNDLVVERTEDFSLALNIASGLATTTASNNYTITSDDTAVIGFAATSSSAPESLTPHAVNASITLGGTGTGVASIEEAITVVVIDAPGTATTPADYTLTTISITFPAGSLNAATTTINSAIVNDALIEGNHDFVLGFGAVTTDLTGVSASGAHTVTIFDDDFAGVEIIETAGDTIVTEGGATDTFTITLTAEPTSDVTITFDVGTQVTFAPNPLVISPANWNVPQTVTVTAVDDPVIEGAHSATVGFTFTGDANFAAITPNSISIVVDIIDNDNPAVLLVESGGNTAVVEGVSDDTFTVALQSQPSAPVTVTVVGDAQLITPAALTFDGTNWNVPQTVTASAVVDLVYEGAHTGTYTFTVTSGDANYNGLTVAPLTVSITDGVSSVIDNGGFEVQGETPQNALRWVERFLTTTDRRLCNASAPAEGLCGYRFQFFGPSNANRQIRQNHPAPAWGFAGDVLNFSVQAKATDIQEGVRARLVVFYEDGTVVPTILTLPGGTYPYTTFTGSVTLTGRVERVVVRIQVGNRTGTMFVDDVELLYTPSGLVTPPRSAEGFGLPTAPTTPELPTQSGGGEVDGLLPLPPAP